MHVYIGLVLILVSCVFNMKIRASRIALKTKPGTPETRNPTSTRWSLDFSFPEQVTPVTRNRSPDRAALSLMKTASHTEPEDPRIGELLVQNADCDDYFVKEDGKCKGGWVLKQPNGECGEGYIPVDDKCWERWMFKLCNGEFTLASETSYCPNPDLICEDIVYTNGGCASRELTGVCNGVFVKKADFCLGQCLDGYVNVNGKCHEQNYARPCNGGHVFIWDVCDGECGDEYGYVYIDGKCLGKTATRLCNGVYILWRGSGGPTCDGKCSTNFVPVNGTCRDWRLYQLCNGVYIPKSDICVGDCGNNYINIDGHCELEWNTRLCNGVPILNSAICDGQCPQDYDIFGKECVYCVMCNGGEGSVADAHPREYSSATGAISDVRLSQQLFYSPRQCPRLYCKKGPKCCLLVFNVQRRKLVCPPQC